MEKMLRHILTSRVYDVAVETPLDEARQISGATGNVVLLKREDLQPVHSFKIRGAYNRIASLSAEECARGVITASAGNHAQGVAYSAMKLGIRAVIVMPKTTPQIKVTAVRSFGAEVILHGDNYSEAADHCLSLVAENGMTFVHPFDDELVIAGQGTIAAEILRQSHRRIDAIFVPVGGGGLISGIGAYFKAISPETRVIGVEPVDSDAMFRSLKANQRVSLDTVGIFADGVAVKKVGKHTFSMCRSVVDEIILVETDEVCSAIKAIFQDTRSVVEPAGALGVAGIIRHAKERGITGQTFVAINSGANLNFERLRYVAERALIGEKHEALYAVTIPERPGALKSFCLDIVGDRNITELNYRYASSERARILVGLAVTGEQERHRFSERMTGAGLENVDLTDNELAKNHIRTMVGGRGPVEGREVLYRFWFPERPGALMTFLNTMSESWNISLFNYRLQGGDYGTVLIGLMIPPDDDRKLRRFLDKLGYQYVDETENCAYRLFM